MASFDLLTYQNNNSADIIAGSYTSQEFFVLENLITSKGINSY